jgi:hypothetical protein
MNTLHVSASWGNHLSMRAVWRHNLLLYIFLVSPHTVHFSPISNNQTLLTVCLNNKHKLRIRKFCQCSHSRVLFREVWRDREGWCNLARDTNQQRVAVNMVLSFQIFSNSGNIFFTSIAVNSQIKNCRTWVQSVGQSLIQIVSILLLVSGFGSASLWPPTEKFYLTDFSRISEKLLHPIAHFFLDLFFAFVLTLLRPHVATSQFHPKRLPPSSRLVNQKCLLSD